MRYRQRPIDTEAIQWTGENADAVRAWLGSDAIHVPPPDSAYPFALLNIPGGTEDDCSLEVGDYIVGGPGAFRRQDAESFERQWEPRDGA